MDATPPLRALYVDVDGTLLGPGGSLFASSEGSPTLEAAAALVALHERDVEVVLMSGRTRRGLHEVARVLGASAYVAELGAILVLADGREIVDVGDFRGAGRVADALARSGVAALLLERFPGRLAPMAPWSEVSVMFQGLVEPSEVEAALEEAGLGWLGFQDNGRLRRTLPELDVPEVHAYHLLPRGVSKASAVRRHRALRGFGRSEAAAVGDSAADLQVAPEVGRLFLVRNGLDQIGDLPPGVRVTDGSHGAGFAEAVSSLLGR